MVVRYLREKMKMKVVMITGDNMHAAFKVANILGIPKEDVNYKAYPQDKKAIVEKLQK